jgi:hypothetical protein
LRAASTTAVTRRLALRHRQPDQQFDRSVKRVLLGGAGALDRATQHGHDGIQRWHTEGGQQPAGQRGRTEPAQAVELLDRHEQLRLVVRVDVATRGAGGERGVGDEPGPGLLGVRVRLQGERLFGGEHLEQVGQALAEPFDDEGAERADRIGADHVRQRQPVRHASWIGRVSTEPQLRLRVYSGHWAALQRREGRSGPPRVGADRPRERPHNVPATSAAALRTRLAAGR